MSNQKGHDMTAKTFEEWAAHPDRDRDEFGELTVWSLEDAFNAGRAAGIEEAANTVRGCGFMYVDPETGPAGCELGDKCVCCGVSLGIRALNKEGE